MADGGKEFFKISRPSVSGELKLKIRFLRLGVPTCWTKTVRSSRSSDVISVLAPGGGDFRAVNGILKQKMRCLIVEFVGKNLIKRKNLLKTVGFEPTTGYPD